MFAVLKHFDHRLYATNPLKHYVYLNRTTRIPIYINVYYNGFMFQILKYIYAYSKATVYVHIFGTIPTHRLRHIVR